MTDSRSLGRRLDQLQVIERARTSYGPTKPSSPATGVPFFDTTAGMWVYWDGARWLTAHEYSTTLAPFGLNPLPFAGAGPSTLVLAPIRTDYQHWYTHSDYYIFVNTTNNATNYWAITFGDSTGASFWATNTSAAGVGQSTGDNVQGVAGGSGALYINVQLTKVGTPGTIGALHFTSYYRLIIP